MIFLLMMTRLQIPFFFLLVLFASKGRAQISLSNSAPYNNQNHLVENVLLGTGVTAFNVTFNGQPAPTNANRIGFFDNTTSTVLGIGLDSGIVMTTGNLTGIAGPNLNGGNTSGPSGQTGSDADLTALAGITTYNRAVLEFDFIPKSDTVKFTYVFGSEEYPEFVNQINDAFGFFVSGPGINGTFSNNAINIALIPGTTSPVTINNVNNNTNSAFYVQNGNHGGFSDGAGNTTNNPDIQFDGFTVPLEAVVAVNACDTYHIKIAVADASDGLLDSGVFLEAKSFSSSEVTLKAQSGYSNFGGDTNLYENCGTHSFIFERKKNFAVQEVIYFDIQGDVDAADLGTYADSVVFAPNDTVKTIVIDLLEDNLVEGSEEMIFKLFPPSLSSCDTASAISYTFHLLDRPPLLDSLTSFRALCSADSVELKATAYNGIPTFDFAWSTGDTTSSFNIPLPSSDTDYFITITDACEVDTLIDTLTVRNDYQSGMAHSIADTFVINCTLDSLKLLVQMQHKSGVYSIRWHGSPPVFDSLQVLTAPIQQGIYRYTIIDSCTANDSLVDSVVVLYDLPTMAIDLQNYCQGTFVTISDSSVASLTPTIGWEWDVGNNHVIDYTSNVFSQVFPDTGSIPIQLILTDSNGCKDSLIRNIVIHPNPVVDFEWENVCFGDTMFFQDSTKIAKGNIANWQWNMGDGSVANTNQHPFHSYSDTGLYSVQLLTLSDSGCSHQLTQQVEVYKLPVANFSFDTVCFNDTSSFIDLSTSLSGTVNQWLWTFGDGDSATTANPKNRYPNDTSYTVTLVATTNLGCTDTTAQQVSTYKLPEVDFAFTNICAYTSAFFADSSTSINGSPIVSWAWDLDTNDTINGTQSTFGKQFTQYGHYPIELRVTDSLGCTDSLTQTLIVNPKPEAGFLFVNVCVGEPVNFFDTSSVALGTNTAWAWDFGDTASIDSTQNPTHNYDSAGFYTVNFIVVSDSGCTDTASGVIQLIAFPFPVTDFTSDNECLGDTNEFFDTSTILFGTIDSLFWHFGEGTANSFEENPKHLYVSYGKFEVTHLAISDQGCATSMKDSIEVYERPSVDFTFTNVCLNDSMPLLDQSTMNSNTMNAWWWNTGDGQPLATTKNYTHRYASADTFSIQLKVQAATTGCLDSTSKDVIVYQLPDVDFSLGNVCEDSTVILTDLTQSPNLSTLEQWFWDIEDNGSVEYSTPNTTEVFTQNGTYSIELRVVDSLNCTDSTVRSVVIHPEPVPNFDFTNVCFGDSMPFVNQSTVATGQIETWNWDFGDGSLIDNRVNPNHWYAQGDTYSVSLTVTSDSGCIGLTTTPVSVIVYPEPTVDFAFTNICVYDSMVFTDLSTIQPNYGTINSWEWNFGDGTKLSTSQNSVHKYATHGYYPVILSVSTPDGCVDTLEQLVQVFEVPKALFSHALICQEDSFELINQTILNSSVMQNWEWDFDEGTKSSKEDPQHRYDSLQTYSVQLIATSIQGCIDSITKTLEVNPRPAANFAYDPTCADSPVEFRDHSSVKTGSLDTWIWNFGDGTDGSPRRNPEHLFDTGGTYQVMLAVQSLVGCRDTLIKPVEVLKVPKVAFDMVPVVGCAPLEVDFINQSTFADGFQLSYEWRFEGDTFIYNDKDLAYTFYNRSGRINNFDVSLRVISPLCESTLKLSDTIEVWPQPTPNFVADPPAVSVFDGHIRFEDKSSSDVLYRDWYLGDGNSESYSRQFEYHYEQPGWYPVVLEVENEYGCTDSTSKRIQIKPEATYYVPNAFTPNGDGDNDYFYVAGEGIDFDFRLRVFSRWGEVVFDGQGLSSRWNGRLPDGTPAPQGTYAYRVTYTDYVNRKDMDRSGSVTLIRNRR